MTATCCRACRSVGTRGHFPRGLALTPKALTLLDGRDRLERIFTAEQVAALRAGGYGLTTWDAA